jgi:arginyl-tRNA synthetase
MNFYKDFYPHVLCEYLYALSEKFNLFFHTCNIKDSNLKESRMLICELTRRILREGMSILGLKIVNKM